MQTPEVQKLDTVALYLNENDCRCWSNTLQQEEGKVQILKAFSLEELAFVKNSLMMWG